MRFVAAVSLLFSSHCWTTTTTNSDNVEKGNKINFNGFNQSKSKPISALEFLFSCAKVRNPKWGQIGANTSRFGSGKWPLEMIFWPFVSSVAPLWANQSSRSKAKPGPEPVSSVACGAQEKKKKKRERDAQVQQPD